MEGKMRGDWRAKSDGGLIELRSEDDAHLLLELKTLPLVLVLQLVLLHLHALEGLDAALDLYRETLNVSGATSKETCKFSLDETEHGRLHARCLLLLRILRRLCVLCNVGYSGARETCGDGCVRQGSILWGGRCRIVSANGNGGRHGRRCARGSG